MTIGIAINSEFKEQGLKLFLKIASNYSDDYDEDYYTNKYNKNLISNGNNAPKLASIYFYFKKYDVEKYKELDKQFKAKNKTNNTKLDDDFIYIETDDGCANILFEEFKDILIQTHGQIFFKKGNIWICDKALIDDNILNIILTKNMCKLSRSGIVKPNSKNISSAKNIREVLYVKISTQTDTIDIYKKFYTTTKGKLSFLDGVLDLANKRFYEW